MYDGLIHKMDVTNGFYTVVNKREPKWSAHPFKKTTIDLVFDFAYGMTFAEEGRHRTYRSGGTKKRSLTEVFANAFQGKLAECAVATKLHVLGLPYTVPDFEKWDEGIWDSYDTKVMEKTISIKSTKFYGNLLLLESEDYDDEGRYLPNLINQKEGEYDFFVLVRIKPSSEEFVKKFGFLFKNEKRARSELNLFMSCKKWFYDVPGFITRDELIYIIENNHIIKKGDRLGKYTRMDADNYYIQAGDLHYFEEIIDYI